MWFESHVSRRKINIYVAFVDFIKFSIRLIGRVVLQATEMRYMRTYLSHNKKSIHSATSYRVRIRNQVSLSLLPVSGAIQRSPMSPVLSNMYQNDIHEMFSKNCDPVCIGDAHVSSISGTDDLLLLSISKDRAATVLRIYIYIWQ